MGFFSWITSDTNESIQSCHASVRKGKVFPSPKRPVYMLTPKDVRVQFPMQDGDNPFEELTADEPWKTCSYEGYGDFAGIDVHEWLGRVNAPYLLDFGGIDPLDISPEDYRNIGIQFECGSFFVDDDTGEEFAYRAAEGSGHTGFTGSYQTPQEGYDGRCPNELKDDGTWRECRYEVRFPLKFVEDPTLRYEDVKPSPSCPAQGYFY